MKFTANLIAWVKVNQIIDCTQKYFINNDFYLLTSHLNGAEDNFTHSLEFWEWIYSVHAWLNTRLLYFDRQATGIHRIWKEAVQKVSEALKNIQLVYWEL